MATYSITYSGKFKKDFKKYQKKAKELKAIIEVIELIRLGTHSELFK